MRYGEYYTYGSNRPTEYKILTCDDRFEQIDDLISKFPQTFSSYKPQSFNMIISVYGEFWTTENSHVDLADKKIERNRVVNEINRLDDLIRILPIRDFINNEEFHNYHFNRKLGDEIRSYGLDDLYPEFLGIEISLLPTSSVVYCGCYSLIKIKGKDSETFHNARTLTK